MSTTIKYTVFCPSIPNAFATVQFAVAIRHSLFIRLSTRFHPKSDLSRCPELVFLYSFFALFVPAFLVSPPLPSSKHPHTSPPVHPLYLY
jgi:hypothetical protein